MRTDQEIVDQTNEIARILYRNLFGCEVPKGTEFQTETPNRHPHETACWISACEIQELMTQTDVNDALDGIDG